MGSRERAWSASQADRPRPSVVIYSPTFNGLKGLGASRAGLNGEEPARVCRRSRPEGGAARWCAYSGLLLETDTIATPRRGRRRKVQRDGHRSSQPLHLRSGVGWCQSRKKACTPTGGAATPLRTQERYRQIGGLTLFPREAASD